MAIAPDYTSYELSPGACNEQVEATCKHLTEGGSFTNNSQISQTDVDTFITSTYYEMGGWLAAHNLSPTQTLESVIGILQFYNALGASARAELSIATSGLTRVGSRQSSNLTENTRFNFLWRQYHDGLWELLDSGALVNLGATELPVALQDASALTAGGISKQDKKTIEDDEDATKYSFTRKGFDNPYHQTQTVIDERAVTSSELP